MTDSVLAVSRTPNRAKRYRLDHVSDESLHTEVKTLAGRHNLLTADLLAHLAEVEARGIHRERACSSLYTYCVYELRFSEDEAQRRARAARTAREFPVLFEMLADGAIHLTGLLLLAPYLTAENYVGLLARARFRTKREIERLVAEVAPRPDVPARIEPLGPRPMTNGNGWQAFTASLRGAVRNLPSGLGRGEAPLAVLDESACVSEGALAAGLGEPEVTESVEEGGSSGVANDGEDDDSSAPERIDAPGAPFDARKRVPLRYRVEFTASEAYVELLEEARNLLQHQVPNRDIARVHELAMAAFVEQLKKRRHGASGCSRSGGSERARVARGRVAEGRSAPARMGGTDGNAASRGVGASQGSAPARITRHTSRAGGQRGDTAPNRHVPAAIRRAIWQRDEGRCTFTDAAGRRCEERGGLEIDHGQAFALGGPTTVENLRLVCRAHNALLAERDLGREFVKRKKGR